MLTQGEAALQRGELASPTGRNAVALFTGALELDPSNTLAKAGLVRVADRLLSAAERALTAGNVEDARNMVAVEKRSRRPRPARLSHVQIEWNATPHPTRTQDSAAQDKQEKVATYVRLANTRMRSGELIEPSADNARFYLEAARELLPEDPSLLETSRGLQRQLLDRAANAAVAGNAAETERWLANADGAGAARQDMTTIRRSLQDTLISARAGRLTDLTRSFTAALSGDRLLRPANDNAKAYLLELINTDASSASVNSARQGLGAAYLVEARAALTRNDLVGADSWLSEAHTIGFTSAEIGALEKQLAEARTSNVPTPDRGPVVGASSLQRLEYVAPKFPASTRNRGSAVGWNSSSRLRADGSTGDIVITNSSPRNMFDKRCGAAVASAATSRWVVMASPSNNAPRCASASRINNRWTRRAHNVFLIVESDGKYRSGCCTRSARLARRFHRDHGLDILGRVRTAMTVRDYDLVMMSLAFDKGIEEPVPEGLDWIRKLRSQPGSPR